MKLSSNNIISFLAGAALCLGACFILSSNDDMEKVVEGRPVISSVTVNPEIPSSVVFCDERVDLTRYNRHEAFDRELTSFTYLHSTTMLLIKRANRYFPIIEPILKANGIPDDFKYLAVIESYLDPRVSSPAKAVGTWQMLEGTAKQYGLTITPTVDERCDVVKATVAACKYLKDGYEKYGNWVDVAASYNAGMGRITGELTRQDVDSSLELWVVEETSRYVYRIMAMKQIFENPYKYGFVLGAQDLYKPLETTAVTVTSDIQDLATYAKGYGVTYADLKRLNPWLRDRKLVTGGKSYQIQIPEESDLYYKTPNTFVHDRRWVVK